MNKWILAVLSLVLALSFILVYLLSPSDSEYLARHAPENYVTVAAFDVPPGQRSVDITSSLFPFSYKVARLDIDRVEIRVNRNIPGNLLDYMQRNLKAELIPVPESYVRFVLEIRFPRPVRYYIGETFNIVRIFDYYSELMDEHAEFMICIPKDYNFSN